MCAPTTKIPGARGAPLRARPEQRALAVKIESHRTEVNDHSEITQEVFADDSEGVGMFGGVERNVSEAACPAIKSQLDVLNLGAGFPRSAEPLQSRAVEFREVPQNSRLHLFR